MSVVNLARFLAAVVALSVAVSCGSTSSRPETNPRASAGTSASATASPSTTAAGPTAADIRRQLRSVVELANPDTHFSLMDGPVRVSDGAGGLITAAIGVRWPTADAKGQLLFLWHNRKFLGWAPGTEAYAIGMRPYQRAGGVTVLFALYPRGTAMCCPRGSVRVRFRLAGGRMKPDRPLPASALSSSAVRRTY